MQYIKDKQDLWDYALDGTDKSCLCVPFTGYPASEFSLLEQKVTDESNIYYIIQRLKKEDSYNWKLSHTLITAKNDLAFDQAVW